MFLANRLGNDGGRALKSNRTLPSDECYSVGTELLTSDPAVIEIARMEALLTHVFV